MERIGDEVRRELGRIGPATSIGALVDAWPAAVGEAIARNAWPARVARDGTLHVATSSSAWAFELAQLAPEIAARLEEHAPEAAPKAIRFAPGSLPEPAVEASPAAAPARPPSPAEWATANELASAIRDEELRAVVARAAAGSLARAAADRPFWYT
jgi:hypothetical protein